MDYIFWKAMFRLIVGQMTEDNIEIGLCNESGFKRLTPAEVKDYLAAIA